jgi:transposase
MKAYSEDLRKKVLTAYQDEEVSMRQLAERFMVSLTFVFNLIKNFRQNGHIRPKPHGGGNTPAINEEGFGILAEIIKKKSDMTLKELCEYYEDKTGKKVSKSAMDRTLKKMGITRKKKVLYDPEKNTVRVRRLTEEYSEKVKAEVPDNLIFIDETGATLNMTLPYGRSPEGERVIGTRPVSQGQRISTIGALSTEEMVACMTFEGTLNGEVFLSYLSDFLCPVLKEGQVVITDNARAHKVKGVKELIESKGAKLVYLPPYSPELSPIEMCWSKVKQFLKKAGARTEEALNEAISEALNMITENDCKGWFGHCGYVV